MLGAMHDGCSEQCSEQCSEHRPSSAQAMHERTDGLTNAEPPNPPRDEAAEVSDAGARVPRRLAYAKACDGCGVDIFMAICRDGRWRPFETQLQTVPLSFAWAWRKRHGMEETDRVCGHLIHYCADYHDRAFQFADNVIYPKERTA